MAEKNALMKQYQEMKERYPDTIVFFRLGDFYEMFHQDAVTVSRELNLTLTSREKKKPEEERTPMCGVPFHSSEVYVAKLVAKGYKVAICEQIDQEPTTGKPELKKREVVRVVTQGTILEPSMLEESKNNYLCTIFFPNFPEMEQGMEELVLCFCDISTGSIFYRIITNSNDMMSPCCNELARFAPREVLLSPGAMGLAWLRDFLQESLELPLEEGQGFSCEQGETYWESRFPTTNAPSSPCFLSCFGGLMGFLQETFFTELSHLSIPVSLDGATFLELNQESRRNLELTETLWSREKKGSLLWVLDKTKTAMGSRTLREWLQRPLLSLVEIQKRQDLVGELKEKLPLCQEIQEILREIPDLQRVTARIGYGSASPKEIRSVALGLSQVATLKGKSSQLESVYGTALTARLEDLPDLVELLFAALKEDLPVSPREGGLIAPGFHQEVDKFNHVMNHGEDMMAELENRAKEETGIRNLRVKYNANFGYLFEVNHGQKQLVPDQWDRKQTLTNAERYSSKELKELEHMILTAKDQVVNLEYELFKKLRDEVCKFTSILQETARAIAELDVVASLAQVARTGNYVAPQMTDSTELEIRNGRHPAVEKMLKDGLFVPNDTHFHPDSEICNVITGANMSGKSTYMRQVALIVLMAQIGSFVPAFSAKIGIVDQIFTRIGASDDLASGRSTFMVEMSEVAQLLSHATPRSLLILDEIGRGTSTHDGMAIARAVLEHCRLKIGAKTLFATHYHELSQVAEDVNLVKNYNLSAKQQGDQLLFLRKIMPGGADQSYGIQVAQLAGVPQEVIDRAHEILVELESNSENPQPKPRKTTKSVQSPEEILEKEVISALRGLDLDELTPRNAWEILESLKQRLP